MVLWCEVDWRWPFDSQYLKREEVFLCCVSKLFNCKVTGDGPRYAAVVIHKDSGVSGECITNCRCVMQACMIYGFDSHYSHLFYILQNGILGIGIIAVSEHGPLYFKEQFLFCVVDRIDLNIRHTAGSGWTVPESVYRGKRLTLGMVELK